jgi:hypothetical protein
MPFGWQLAVPQIGAGKAHPRVQRCARVLGVVALSRACLATTRPCAVLGDTHLLGKRVSQSPSSVALASADCRHGAACAKRPIRWR